VQGVRVSPALLERIASVLMLDDAERFQIFQLAVPELRSALHPGQDGIVEAFRPIRLLARRLTTVSSLEEAAEAAIATMQAVLLPSCLSSVTFDSNDARRIIATGPKADAVVAAMADTCIASNYPNRFGHATFNESRPGREEARPGGSFVFQQRTSDGDSFIISAETSFHDRVPTVKPSRTSGTLCDLNVSAGAYWEWNDKVQSRSSLTNGLFANGVYQGNFCALWRDPHEIAPVEIETLKTVSALVELAATGR
jgi:hypothetical protein